jgi:hypothetical protein
MIMIKRSIIIFCFSVFINILSFAQDSTSHSSLSFSGYVDAYAAYYTDSLGINNYQKFPSVSPRSNQFGLNVAMLTAKYSADKVRGIVTLHYGDIPRSTWSGNYNFIQEANVGVRLHKKIWLDAGFFRTHVGTEGLFPKENITSSVSVCTYMEPYYEAGFKLNYSPSDKLSINLFLLNGYNIYEDNNTKKSVGALITYVFNDNFNIGYSDYVGDDSQQTDSITHMRIYHNLFFNYQIKKIKIQVGGDYGMQENSDTTGKKSASMYSGVASVKYQCTSKFAFYSRGELFNDPQGFMSGVFINDKNVQTGLKLWGVTAGVEYKPTDNSYIRLEGRQLQTDDDQHIFRWEHKNMNKRMEAMIHMGVSF